MLTDQIGRTRPRLLDRHSLSRPLILQGSGSVSHLAVAARKKAWLGEIGPRTGRTGRVWHALGHPASGVTYFSLFAD